MSVDPAVWFDFKEFVRHSTGWPMDTLHVMGGVILQRMVAALLRTSLASKWPWLIVLGLELANEAYDLWPRSLARSGASRARPSAEG